MNLDYFKNTKQTWDFSIVNVDKKYPFLLIDNYYTPEEEKMVWQELEYYASWPKDLTLRSETSKNVSKDYHGKSKGYSWRFYIDRMFRRKEGYCSHIFNLQYKQKLTSFQNAICKIEPYSSSFIDTNADSTMLSYYEDSDSYDTHHDTAAWTQLTWFVKEPRRFDGGDFVLEQPKIKIKLKHNRSVLFPSMYDHRVIPLKSHDNMERGYGRWSITHFYYVDEHLNDDYIGK